MVKHVQLEDLLAGLPRSGTMTTSAARALAHDILDRCEAVDPTEEEGEWERHAECVDREELAGVVSEAALAFMKADGSRLVNERQAARLAAAGANDQRWRSEVMRMGFDLREPTPHLIQAMRGGKVFAEWWPSKGTTMHAQKRGPRCADAAAFLRWLRTLVG